MLKEKEKKHKQEKDKEGRKIFQGFLIFLFSVYLPFTFFNSKTKAEVPTQENTEELTKDITSIEDKNKKLLYKLDELEEKIFHHKFKNEQSEHRIDRLEEFIFGEKYSDLTLEKRMIKLTSALNLETAIQGEPKPQVIPEQKQAPKVVYDESFNVGVVGTISQIEQRIFNQIFNNLSFDKRIENLEERILSRQEISKNRKNPLIERVSYLVQKTNLMPQAQLHNAPPQVYTPQSYTIDTNTGYLINEQTREIIRDFTGNPIYVKIPQQFIPYQNQFPNYGQNQKNQIPPELFLNPNNLDTGGDEGF